MFNSSKIGDSPRVNKNSPHKTVNETANGIPRSFLHPKITSTPLGRRDSIYATPPKPHPLSPRRYSLSEIATPPRQPNKRDLTGIHTTGPLLASTKFNVSIGTYEDTKSPGLAGRIVQYNEETEREMERQRTPTHQAKYSSPGLFPVVHLFKKRLPVLEQKPRRVTIRIASPEYSRQHSQEYNRKLLEGIIKPNLPYKSRHLLASPSGENNNSGTRSVLDALKEISRKRIHANEEYESNEDSGKRIRTENFNDTDSNKRTRDDSPLLDSSPSPTKPGSKRICMYDEYAASCSSMNFSFKKSDQSVPKRKSISISTLTENPKDSKQVKLINVETQTVIIEDGRSTTPNKVTTDVEKNQTSDGKPHQKKESPVKIFDDAPLERIRKNRLAALMGSLAGKDPVLTPKPDYATALNSSLETPTVPETSIVEVPKTTDKPLISILASPKKDSPSKSIKHVHFSIPESTSQTILSTPSITGFSITQSSPSITSPISSACEVKTSFGLNKNEENLETPAPPSSPVGLTPTSSDTTTAMPALMFGAGGISNSATSVVSKESSTLLGMNTSKSDTAVPNFQFQVQVPNAPTPSTSLGGSTSHMSFSGSTSAPSQITFGSVVTSAPSSTASPPKLGGFKFDLSKPAVTSTPTFSFGITTQKKPLFETTTTSAAPNSSSTLGGFSFGVNSTSLVPSSTSTTTTSSFSTSNAFAIPTTSSPNTSALPTFKFSSTNVDNKAAGLGFGLTPTNTATFGPPNTATSSMKFGTKTSTTLPISTAPTSTVPAFDTSKPSVFSFGATNAPAKPIGFGIATTTSIPLTFGTPSTTALGGFRASAASGFGAPSAPLPPTGFGVTTTALAITNFGAPTTISGGFATSTTPAFGDNKSTSPFGITTSAPSAFGTSTAPNSSPFGKSIASAFGQNATQPSFGAPTTTVSFGTANAFGGTTTTSSSVFERPTSASSFGKPSNTPSIFGGVATTQASGFGVTNSKPLFGTATNSPFGSSTPATTASAFGSKTTPTFNFGAKTTAGGAFGTSNVFGTATTASTGFGTTTTPAFGTSNVFGGGSSNFGTNNAFGNSTTPAFGAATTTTQSTGFATANTAPTFGSPDGDFGANNKNSVFGNSSTSAFGPTATPSFGTPAPTTAFGVPSNTSAFGTNTASAFAKPQTAFGSTSNAFGTNTNFGASQPQASSFGTTNPLSTQTPVFSFGTTTTPKPAGVFSFGTASSSEPLKPTFNFTGGNSTPGFGSAGAPSFGSSGTPSFGAGGVPQFNAPQPAATGMFSIGSGSSSGRTRTQLKAKRRT